MVRAMIFRALRAVLFLGGILYAGFFLAHNHAVLTAHPPAAKHVPS
jgi:hypothetical protein